MIELFCYTKRILFSNTGIPLVKGDSLFSHAVLEERLCSNNEGRHFFMRSFGDAFFILRGDLLEVWHEETVIEKIIESQNNRQGKASCKKVTYTGLWQEGYGIYQKSKACN